MSHQASRTLSDIAASFSEEEFELFEERQEMAYQNVMESTENMISSTKDDPVFNPESSLWIKEVEEPEFSEQYDSEGSRSSGSPSNPVYNPDIVSQIKQEEDSDFMETDNSDDSEYCEEGGRIEYVTRSKTSARATKELQIKVEEETSSIDDETSEDENTVMCISRKPGSEQIKEEEMSSEDSIDQCSDKNISWERQKMPQRDEGNVSEYKLDRISLYETGFCVINDPFVPQGIQAGETPYHHPELMEHPKLYKCNECGRCFQNSDQLRVHKVAHKGENPNLETLTPSREIPYSCKICKKRFIDNSSLVEHMKSHTERCYSEIHNSAPLKHRRTHTDVKKPNLGTLTQRGKPFKCNECGSNFRDNSSLLKHSVTHTRKPYACTECEQCFSQRVDLMKHVKMHTEKTHNHTVCEDSLFDCSSLVTHQAINTEEFGNVSPEKEEKHTCNKCEKTFSYKSSLVSHQRTHTGERPYKCNECDKSFIHISTLYKHQITHVNPVENPYQCTECGERFKQTSSLAKHRRSHTIARPYKCYECEKSFTQNSNLIKHQKTHREDNRNSARLQHQRNTKKETEADKGFNNIIIPTQFKVTHPRATDCDKTLVDMPSGDPHHGMQTIEKDGTSLRDIATLALYQETHYRVIDFDDIFIDMASDNEQGTQSKENDFNKTLNNDNQHKLEKWFTCGNCGQRFSEHLLLIKHERIHI